MEISTKFTIGSAVLYKNKRYRIEKIIMGKDKVVKYEISPFFAWLQENPNIEPRVVKENSLKRCTDGILEPDEKKYLEDVLRPYKDEKINICKSEEFLTDNERLYIEIGPQNGVGNNIELGRFPKHTQYKPMVTEMWYSKEELGLFKEVKNNE